MTVECGIFYLDQPCIVWGIPFAVNRRALLPGRHRLKAAQAHNPRVDVLNILPWSPWEIHRFDCHISRCRFEIHKIYTSGSIVEEHDDMILTIHVFKLVKYALLKVIVYAHVWHRLAFFTFVCHYDAIAPAWRRILFGENTSTWNW